MDVTLYWSVWIRKNEGLAAWRDWMWYWQRFQTAEPVEDEQERGEYLVDWFDDLEVGK